MEDKNKINEDLKIDDSENKEIVLEDNPSLNVSILEEQLKEEKGKYMLLYADFENYKKRVQRDKDELKNNTKVSMITSILDMDNDISLAIKNIKDDSAREGVELIASKIQSFLKNHGIEPIQTETYDEDLHEEYVKQEREFNLELERTKSKIKQTQKLKTEVIGFGVRKLSSSILSLGRASCG
jgi:molecular chaperone GrpE